MEHVAAHKRSHACVTHHVLEPAASGASGVGGAIEHVAAHKRSHGCVTHVLGWPRWLAAAVSIDFLWSNLGR
jgi:hypothetical protein